MDDAERKAYARHQIADAAKHVDYVGLFESYPEYAGAPEDESNDLSDEDGRAVDDLIRSATVVASWPAEGTGWWAEDVTGADGVPQWSPTLQIGGQLCIQLPVWQQSREQCELFIREYLVGAPELPPDL